MMLARVFSSSLLFLLFVQVALAAQQKALGPSAVESTLSFKSTVVLAEGMKPTPANIKFMIHEQTKHLLSEFESAEYAKYIGAPANNDIGVIGLGQTRDYEVLKQTKNSENLWEVTYHANQRVLVYNKFLQPGETKQIPFFVPRDPTRIYVRSRAGKEWPQKEYFYYYWEPPYKEKDRALFTGKDTADLIKGDLTALSLPDTSVGPNFQRLWKQAAAKNELLIALLVGFDEKSTNPKDLGRVSYNQFYKWFVKNGFEPEHRQIKRTGPFTDFIKRSQNGGVDIRVALTLSDSDINHPVTFSRRAREAFEKADIVYYDGHSGLGGNLNMEMIASLSSEDREHPTPIKFSPDYQIYYFDSCASFYFYSDMYLSEKDRGDLDMVTNGLTSDFSTQNPETLAFLTTLMRHYQSQNTRPTWLDVLRDVEHKQDSTTYLLNVTNVPAKHL